MRLSILAALGLSSTSVLAQDSSEQSSAPACENPQPIRSELPGDSGYLRCEDGRVLRDQAIWDLPGNPGPGCKLPKEDLLVSNCMEDSDCTARPFGFCSQNWNLGPGVSCLCEYRCMSDLDCRIGQVCAAADVSGSGFKKCINAVDCRTNLDCPSGQCEVSKDRSFLGGGGAVTMACRSSRDECQGDADCEFIGCGGCDYNPEVKRWACSTNCTIPGRPFIVEGEAAVADVKPRSDWISQQSFSFR